MDELKHFRTAFFDCLKFVFFLDNDELWERLSYRHFIIGLLTTWLVGIGRNWDFPEAPLFAKTGLPSVAYIFILSAVFWILSWPVSYRRLSYFKILTLISMTAAPGLVYAIPVEMMLSMQDAQAVNLLFLTVVAIWRVGLAYSIFVNGGQNSAAVATSIILLPVCLIIIGLVMSGRAGYVIEIMGGVNRPENVNTGVNEAVAAMFCLAWPVGAIALIIWGIAISTVKHDR